MACDNNVKMHELTPAETVLGISAAAVDECFGKPPKMDWHDPAARAQLQLRAERIYAEQDSIVQANHLPNSDNLIMKTAHEGTILQIPSPLNLLNGTEK